MQIWVHDWSMNIFDTIMFTKSVLIVVKALRVTFSSVAMTQKHTQSAQNHLSWPVFVLVPKATGGKSFATQSRKHSVYCSHQFCDTVSKGCENNPQLALTMKPNDVLTTNEWQMFVCLFWILWEGKDIKQGYEPGRNKQVKSAGLKKWVQWVHHHKQQTISL